MNSREKILDLSVAIMVLLCLFWAIAMTLYLFFSPETIENKRLIIETLSPSLLLDVLALMTCLILVLWLRFGKGVESKLWNWLPPFVFLRDYGKIVRIIFVILLIAGTLLGALGEMLGLPQAF